MIAATEYSVPAVRTPPLTMPATRVSSEDGRRLELQVRRQAEGDGLLNSRDQLQIDRSVRYIPREFANRELSACCYTTDRAHRPLCRECGEGVQHNLLGWPSPLKLLIVRKVLGADTPPHRIIRI